MLASPTGCIFRLGNERAIEVTTNAWLSFTEHMWLRPLWQTRVGGKSDGMNISLHNHKDHHLLKDHKQEYKQCLLRVTILNVLKIQMNLKGHYDSVREHVFFPLKKKKKKQTSFCRMHATISSH